MSAWFSTGGSVLVAALGNGPSLLVLAAYFGVMSLKVSLMRLPAQDHHR